MEINIEQLRVFSSGMTQEINNLLLQLKDDAKPLIDEDIIKVIEKPENHLFVAKDSQNNKIVGMAIIVIIDTFLRKKALLEELVVDENYRGKGIGEKLLNLTIERSRQEGAVRYEFTSNPKRIEAIKLYQEMGFEKRDTNVYRMDL